jgi:hypothetical protein
MGANEGEAHLISLLYDAGGNRLSLRRQNRQRFHFDEIRRIGEPRYPQQGRGAGSVALLAKKEARTSR